jgi:thiamine biosynthesis lipoprotein
MSTMTTPPTARYVRHVMGMPISLALRGRHTDDHAARAAWSAAMAELHEVDRVFSTYREDSFISRMGRGEIGVEDCPAEVAEVLTLGEEAEAESGGAFSVWLPGPHGGTRLDPSRVAKGWAAERAATPLRRLADTDFSLSAGGYVLCRTLDPDGPPWRIGVEDPAEPNRILAVIPVLTGAVATSGTAHRGRHLVDARTGRSPSGVASVTVVAGSLTAADIDATAAYAQGDNAARWLETRPHRSALVVWGDGRTTTVEPVLRGSSYSHPIHPRTGRHPDA